MINRFYFIPTEEPNMNSIIEIAVGTLEEQRERLDGIEIVIMLHEDDYEQHEVLKPFREYSCAGACEYMNNDNWTRQP